MNFWFIAGVLAIAYVVQLFLGYHQLQNFQKNYASLRRRGKVAIGKRKNSLSAGAIALFLVDENGQIVEGRSLSGTTVLCRFRPLTAFDRKDIGEISAKDDKQFSPGLRRAIDNARDNWLTVQRGGTPPEPPTPLDRLVLGIKRLTSRKSYVQGVTS